MVRPLTRSIASSECIAKPLRPFRVDAGESLFTLGLGAIPDRVWRRSCSTLNAPLRHSGAFPDAELGDHRQRK